MALKKNKIVSIPKEEWPVDSLGKVIPQKTLVQWRTATVAQVQAGEDNGKPWRSKDDIGAIWVLEHHTDAGIKKETFAPMDDANRYIPLLRGMSETPAVGDQVLVGNFADTNYYLGPLNVNNDVQKTTDNLKKATQIRSGEEEGTSTDEGNKTLIDTNVRKLSKRLNPRLDNPILNSGKKDPETGEVLPDVIMPEMLNLWGDMILEGRHGNSLRIGSRNLNPYIYISNGRGFANPVETSLDGTILGIFNHGSIRDHFPYDNKRFEEKGEKGANLIKKKYKFSLADSEIDPIDPDSLKGTPKRSIGQTLTTSMGRGLGPTKSEHNETYNRPEPGGADNDKAIPDPDIENTIYNYQDNQFFLSSDRITFNARKARVRKEGDKEITEGDGSIYIAANKYLNFGSGNNINLSTSNVFLVEAATSMVVNTPMFKVDAPGKVYIDGRKNTDKDDEIVGSIFLGNPLMGDKMSQAVLGDALCSWLCMLISEIQNICLCVSEAVENREMTGAAYDIMSQRADALDDLMGVVQKKLSDGSTVAWPENMAKWILSDSVRIKK